MTKLTPLAHNLILLFELNPGLNITLAEFKKYFEFATSGTYFHFQGTFCKQKDGVAMSSPLVLLKKNNLKEI